METIHLQKKKRTLSTADLNDKVQHEAPPSSIHLDCFHHQGSPSIDPNPIDENIARMHFEVAFLSENAYNIQRRLDVEFQPSIDWMQLPLDVKEEIVNCPPSMHNDDEVAPSFAALDQSTRIKVLPPPTWKHLHPKISKPSSLMTLQKTVYKIPYGAYKEVVTYDRHCWMVSKD